MAINTNPTNPLKHVATFTATGNYVVPQSTSVVFVSLHSASGGSGSQPTSRYNGSGLPGGLVTGAGGAGVVSGAFVSVTPGGTYPVTIGAAGAAGANQSAPNNSGLNGGSGGTTSFDTAISASGAAGGTGSGRYSSGTNGAVASAATGVTTLTSVSPPGAIVRTGTISSQATGGSAGGAAVNVTNRYTTSNPGTGNAGAAGIVHVYV